MHAKYMRLRRLCGQRMDCDVLHFDLCVKPSLIMWCCARGDILHAGSSVTTVSPAGGQVSIMIPGDAVPGSVVTYSY